MFSDLFEWIVVNSTFLHRASH